MCVLFFIIIIIALFIWEKMDNMRYLYECEAKRLYMIIVWNTQHLVINTFALAE